MSGIDLTNKSTNQKIQSLEVTIIPKIIGVYQTVSFPWSSYFAKMTLFGHFCYSDSENATLFDEIHQMNTLYNTRKLKVIYTGGNNGTDTTNYQNRF